MLANVKAQMWKNKLTNSDMAKVLGVSTNTFSFKLNERREFTLSELSKMASYFGVSIDYLIAIRNSTTEPVPPEAS